MNLCSTCTEGWRATENMNAAERVFPGRSHQTCEVPTLTPIRWKSNVILGELGQWERSELRM